MGNKIYLAVLTIIQHKLVPSLLYMFKGTVNKQVGKKQVNLFPMHPKPNQKAQNNGVTTNLCLIVMQLLTRAISCFDSMCRPDKFLCQKNRINISRSSADKMN
uniref:Uncharacterized protein n=1 Tax=Pseudictyota dubia TaxID=2749911 RepID=A0A6U2D3W6_9STRA|mmetsp:Transcript_27734/g.51599  ORF Transcript_27734/g.51599 Transcript_27734/m.51599 type:complete len:103 (+) Transcript_27734:321-629(+)